MKRILTYISAGLLMFVTACAPNPQKIAEKIEKGETLSESEYTEACNYSLSIITQIGDSAEVHKGDFIGIVQSLRHINDENPYANMIVETLINSDPASLSEENSRLREKLIKNLEGVMETIGKEGPVIRLNSDSPANVSAPTNTSAPADSDSVSAMRKLQ